MNKYLKGLSFLKKTIENTSLKNLQIAFLSSTYAALTIYSGIHFIDNEKEDISKNFNEKVSLISSLNKATDISQISSNYNNLLAIKDSCRKDIRPFNLNKDMF